MDFDLQPTLSGSLIQLRPLAKEDFADLYECASDPKVWEQHPHLNRYERVVFQKFFDGAIESHGAFAIVDLETSKIVGSSRYYGLNAQNRQITVGYTFLKTDYWGGKFNRELKTLMLNHAFRFVDSVTFEIGISNLRSRKAIEKIGARLLRNEDLDSNPHVVYGINRKDFVEALG
jgi:RimJ/RimL family protein N-acetyltransferase